MTEPAQTTATCPTCPRHRRRGTATVTVDDVDRGDEGRRRPRARHQRRRPRPGLRHHSTSDTNAVLDMTLTSAACPLTDVIEDQTNAAPSRASSTTSRSTGSGCRRGARTRSPTTAASSCAPSASTSDRTPVTRRVVEVAPARLDGWVAGFHERHGDGPFATASSCASRGSQPLPYFSTTRSPSCSSGAAGMPWASPRGGRLTAHKVGTRYVQSRTAAGGWSQQRFARRRANQADGLVGAAAEHAVRLLSGIRPAPGVPTPRARGRQGARGDAARRTRGWPAPATCRAASSTTCPTRASTSSSGPSSAAALCAST